MPGRPWSNQHFRGLARHSPVEAAALDGFGDSVEVQRWERRVALPTVPADLRGMFTRILAADEAMRPGKPRGRSLCRECGTRFVIQECIKCKCRVYRCKHLPARDSAWVHSERCGGAER